MLLKQFLLLQPSSKTLALAQISHMGMRLKQSSDTMRLSLWERGREAERQRGGGGEGGKGRVCVCIMTFFFKCEAERLGGLKLMLPSCFHMKPETEAN